MDVVLNSVAKCTVIALTADFEELYASVFHSGRQSGRLVNVSEPEPEDMLTIRPAGDRPSSGSIAFVTANTPNTLVS
jgi:hypothetical protein